MHLHNWVHHHRLLHLRAARIDEGLYGLCILPIRINSHTFRIHLPTRILCLVIRFMYMLRFCSRSYSFTHITSQKYIFTPIRIECANRETTPKPIYFPVISVALSSLFRFAELVVVVVVVFSSFRRCYTLLSFKFNEYCAPRNLPSPLLNPTSSSKYRRVAHTHR